MDALLREPPLCGNGRSETRVLLLLRHTLNVTIGVGRSLKPKIVSYAKIVRPAQLHCKTHESHYAKRP